jgi:serine/threonine protein kinase
MNYLQSTNIPPYTLQEFIGKGSTSFVFKGINEITKLPVTIKIIPKFYLNSSQSLTRINREISFLKILNHPLIAQFYEAREDEQNYYLIIEFLENGSLDDAIRKYGNFTEIVAQRYFVEIIASIEYLHEEMRISHRDLKPGNIMLDRNDHISLIDFGLSNHFDLENETLRTKCGTRLYCAPEILLGKAYTKSVDFWSLGVILYQMLTGVLPFQGNNIQQFTQNQSKHPFFPPYLSQNVVSLLQGLLTPESSERLNLIEIKNHRWFSNSYYSFICQTFEKLKNVEAQKKIIDKLKEKKMNTKLIISEMKENISSIGTCCYKQLRRELQIESMCEEMQMMKSQAHLFPQPNQNNLNVKKKRSLTFSNSYIPLAFHHTDSPYSLTSRRVQKPIVKTSRRASQRQIPPLNA